MAKLRSSYVLVSLGAVAWRSYSTSGVRHGQVIDLLACRKVGPRFDFMPGTCMCGDSLSLSQSNEKKGEFTPCICSPVIGVRRKRKYSIAL